MERRTLLTGFSGALGAGALAGCLTGSGDPETDSGDQETLEPTTATPDETTDASDDTATETDDEESDDGDGVEETTDGTGDADVDFETAVESVEKCAKTCRTLTYELQNLGTDPAPDVVVTITVYTGGEHIWEEDQEVGDVDARSQRTGISRDIDVGILGGRKIKANDGQVTIELTPSAAGVSETFTFERTLDV